MYSLDSKVIPATKGISVMFAKDKLYLQELIEALDISINSLKLDTCRDYNLVGRRGIISTEGDSWYLYTSWNTKAKWTVTKKRLNFMEVSQDGDEEGILKLSRMPTSEEAQLVRKICGFSKRPVLTEEERARRKSLSTSLQKHGVFSTNIELKTQEGG